MKQQKESLLNSKPGYTKDQLIAEAHNHGFDDFDTRQLTDFTKLGLICNPRKIGKPGGGTEKGQWPEGQLPLLLTILKLRDRADRQVGHHLYRRPRFCAIPVSGWLYWGEEHSSVPLTQVKCALTTWAKSYQQSNAGQAEQEVNTLFQLIVSQQATKGEKKILKELLEKIFYNGIPLSCQDADELREYLRCVIDPDDRRKAESSQFAPLANIDEIRKYFHYIANPANRGEMRDPKFAPLFAESALHLTNFRLIAIQKLLSTSDIPNALWEWARACILHSKKLYREAQPHLFSDLTIDASLRPMFADNETTSACEDLLTMLGVALSGRPWPGLPPFLQPQVWLAGEATCSIQVTMKRSELLLPNGAPYEYISREVTIEARLPTDLPVLKHVPAEDHQEQRATLRVRFTYP